MINFEKKETLISYLNETSDFIIKFESEQKALKVTNNATGTFDFNELDAYFEKENLPDVDWEFILLNKDDIEIEIADLGDVQYVIHSKQIKDYLKCRLVGLLFDLYYDYDSQSLSLPEWLQKSYPFNPSGTAIESPDNMFGEYQYEDCQMLSYELQSVRNEFQELFAKYNYDFTNANLMNDLIKFQN